MQKPFLPKDFEDLRSLEIGRVDAAAMEEIAVQYLGTPPERCEFQETEFGLAYNAPNVFDPFSRSVVRRGIFAWRPGARSAMKSHEFEEFEMVDVLGPGPVTYVEAIPQGPNFELKSRQYEPGQTFPALIHRPGSTYEGFFHSLENPEGRVLFARILFLAREELAMKDGQRLSHGFNRPPNTYNGPQDV